MKKILIILYAFFVFATTSIQAQHGSYSVASTSLSSIDHDLIAVSFQRAGLFNQSYYIEINYGQECVTLPSIGRRVDFLKTCTGLMDYKGDLVEVNNYMAALNLLEKLGWKMVSVVMTTTSEGGSEPLMNQYLFRRKGELN